jgi:hypothetical protein
MPLNKSWHEYNESLIERGRILMDIGFLRSSNREIKNMRSRKFKAQKVEAGLKVMLYNKFISL